MMARYNPLKKILNGEFSLSDDIRKTFRRGNLERRALELSAIVLGTGIYLHDFSLIGIGSAVCGGTFVYDYVRNR